MTGKKSATYGIAICAALALIAAAAGLGRPTGSVGSDEFSDEINSSNLTLEVSADQVNALTDAPSADPAAESTEGPFDIRFKAGVDRESRGVAGAEHNNAVGQPRRTSVTEEEVFATPAVPPQAARKIRNPGVGQANAGSTRAAEQGAVVVGTGEAATEPSDEAVAQTGQPALSEDAIQDLENRPWVTPIDITTPAERKAARAAGITRPPTSVNPELRGPSVCTGIGVHTTIACGEDAWYHTDLRNGFGGSFKINEPDGDNFVFLEHDGPNGFLHSVIDDGTMDVASTVCGLAVLVITDAPQVAVRIRLYTGPSGNPCQSGLGVISPIIQGAALQDFRWCVPGSTTGNPVAVLSRFTPAVPFNQPAGPFLYRMSVAVDPPANLQSTGFVVAVTPGFDSFGVDGRQLATGTGANGNNNCIYFETTPGQATGPLVFVAGPATGWAGFYFAMHGTQYRPGWGTPRRCDVNTNGTPSEAADRDALIGDLNGGCLGATFSVNDVNPCTRADLDGDGKITCLDYATFQSLCRIPATNANGVITGEPAAPVACQGVLDPAGNPRRFAHFTAGGEAGSTAIPADIPDNSPAGVTNGQVLPDQTGVAGVNGIFDVDVDMSIDHQYFGDLTVRLIHAARTVTLLRSNVAAPNPMMGDTGNSWGSPGSPYTPGLTVLVDDGELDTGAPPGSITRPLQFARSNFRIFGRYKPVDPIGAKMTGRVYGGAYGGGTGPGAWRLRVADGLALDTGTLRSWSVHVRLGPEIRGILNPGLDRYRTLGCMGVGGGTNQSFVTFGTPPGTHANNPLLNYSPLIFPGGCAPPGPICAGFFDVGSQPFTGYVELEADSIDPAISDFNFEVQRLLPVTLSQTGVSAGDNNYIVTRYKFRSCSPIQVRYLDRRWSEAWEAQMVQAADQGTQYSLATFYSGGNPSFATGGVYWAIWRLRPRVIFYKSAIGTPDLVFPRELTVTGVLNLSIGARNDGVANPVCAPACRAPYVIDPEGTFLALGVNPDGIVPGDRNFVPNVTSAGFTKVNATLQGADGDGVNPTVYDRNWASLAIRAPIEIQGCPTQPPQLKPLPDELVCGTWGFNVVSTPLAVSTGGCNPASGTLGGARSDVKGTVNRKTFDHIEWPANTDIEVGKIVWFGGYNRAAAGVNSIDDLPGFADALTIEFWRDNAAIAVPPGPPRPDLAFGALLIEGIGNAAIRTDGGFTFPSGNTLKAYRYEYNFLFPVTVNSGARGRLWCAIFNNTSLTSPPLPTGGQDWRWTTTNQGDSNLWATQLNTGLGTFATIGANMVYCVFQAAADPNARVYQGDGGPLAAVCDPAPPQGCDYGAEGLHYRLLTNSATGAGTALINGDELKTLPNIPRNRWINVFAPFKNNSYTITQMGGVPLIVSGSPNPDVRTALEALIVAQNKNPADFDCQIDNLFASLTDANSNTTNDELVDHVYAGKVDYQTLGLTTGTIQQICVAEGLEYAHESGLVNADTALVDNLDVIGIALNRTFLTQKMGGQTGHVAFFVADCVQDKDCNSNGRPDWEDIRVANGGPCTSPPNPLPGNCAANPTSPRCTCSGDCNTNGIPDECDIAAGLVGDCNTNSTPDICEGTRDCNSNTTPDQCEGAFADCNSNLVDDSCEGDCDGDGTPDVCEIAAGAPDCNQNNIPDTCETGQGELQVPNGGMPLGRICFEAGEGYTLGSAIDTNPAIGVGGLNGWDIVLPTDIGFAANGASGFPTGANRPDIATAPTCQIGGPPGMAGQALRFRQDLPSGGNGDTSFFAYGALGPLITTDRRPITYAQADFQITTVTTLDEFKIFAADDFGTPTFPTAPNLIAGVGIYAAGGQIVINSFTTGLGLLFTGNQTINGDCHTVGMRVDGASDDQNADVAPLTVARGQIAYDLNGTVWSYWTYADPPPVGLPISPLRFMVTSDNRNPSAPFYVDCLRLRKAGVFDYRLADCNNNGIRDGCDILAGTSADCNSNGAPDNCDILAAAGGLCDPNAGTAATPLRPIYSSVEAKRRPCSLDCNSNGTPDECEVPKAAPLVGTAGGLQPVRLGGTPVVSNLDRVRMCHDIEDDGSNPTWSTANPIAGQPTTDPMAADDNLNTTLDDPDWSLVALGTFLLPDPSVAEVSSAGTCGPASQCAGGPGTNLQSVRMLVDELIPTNGTNTWRIRSGSFNVPTSQPYYHSSRQRVTADMRIEPGRTTFEFITLGDFLFFSTRLRFGRTGINYGADQDRNGNALGFLKSNQVQVATGFASGGVAIFRSFGTVQDPTMPLVWPVNTCFRLIVEVDGTRPIPSPLTPDSVANGTNVLIGIDTNFDNVPEQTMRVGTIVATNVRQLEMRTDNRITASPLLSPGTGTFDNIRILEYDAMGSGPDVNMDGIPDNCAVVPQCATCRGDMTGNNVVNGGDLQDFVRCYIGGSVAASGCACGDMDNSGTFTSADVDRMVCAMLGWGNTASCPRNNAAGETDPGTACPLNPP